MMTNFELAGELECVWQVRATCGEGPLWIEAEQSLYFVDIAGKTMHCYRLRLHLAIRILY